MNKAGLIGHKGMCGKELLKLIPNLKIFKRDEELDFSDIDTLFMAIPAKETIPIAKKAQSEGVIIIDLSSAFRQDSNLPLVLPTINSQVINNFLTVFPLPNCIVSILLTALAPLLKISPIKQMILSTYQAASGAGKRGLDAINSDDKIAPFPHPLKNNLFLHESEKNKKGLCSEEEKIIFEIRKILENPSLPISLRCVRLPIKRVHSIHAIISFEQNIHNVEEVLKSSKDIVVCDSPNPLEAEESHQVFIGNIRKDPNFENAYDFWICGDQLLRGAALNAFDVFQKLQQKSLPQMQ